MPDALRGSCAAVALVAAVIAGGAPTILDREDIVPSNSRLRVLVGAEGKDLRSGVEEEVEGEAGDRARRLPRRAFLRSSAPMFSGLLTTKPWEVGVKVWPCSCCCSCCGGCWRL